MISNDLNMLENCENSTESQDTILQGGILDAVLKQPTNVTPAELMRNAYDSSSSIATTDTITQVAKAPSTPMSPFQLRSILMEHCYARPYNWRPESHFLRPAKSMFVNEEENKDSEGSLDMEMVDVCDVADEKTVHYDVKAARQLMDECEKHVSGVRDTEEFEDWEEKVPKVFWSKIQHNMFNDLVNILNSDRMSRLAYTDNATEPALRRSVIEKSVKRFRRLMAQYMWDVKLIQWLHSVLMEYLNSWLLGAYLDILQTLTQKLPTFVEKLMGDPYSHNRLSCLNTEHLQKLLKNVWDPFVAVPPSERIKQIPGDPVLVVIPNATALATNTQSKRMTRWIHFLSKIATVVPVTNTVCNKKMTVAHCTDQALLATRSKLHEVQAEYAGRSIFLVGFHSGASIALQVANVDSIVGVICIGFSYYTPEGIRGEPDDNILDLFSPVLFVIGQVANTVLQENLEDIRERMNVETGLLLVGGADDYLRINKRIKRSEGITQSMVDMYIVEEVYDFVSGLLLSPFPPQVRQNPNANLNAIDVSAKRPKLERKRNNSNGSSLDSEPPSPTPRVMRPAAVARIPASKSIRKLDAKYYAKFEGSNVPSSPSSNSITPPNPPSTPESFGDAADYPYIKGAPLADNSMNAKIQGMYSHPGGGSMITHVKHPSGLKIIPSNPNKQIKIIDNITVTPGKMPSKLIRPDMIKSNYRTNMVRMPDGRFKAAPPQPVIRGSSTSQLSKLLTGTHLGGVHQTETPITTTSSPSARASLTKFITSKKQLQDYPTKVMKKTPPYAHAMQAQNLTSQDILNLPIIFADDTQLLPTTSLAPGEVHPTPTTLSSQIRMSAGGQPKVVYVNRQAQKRPPARKLPPGAASAIKYSMPTAVRMDIDVEGELDVNKIPKRMPPVAGYKSEVMSSDMVTSKIKEAIGEGEVDH